MEHLGDKILMQESVRPVFEAAAIRDPLIPSNTVSIASVSPNPVGELENTGTVHFDILGNSNLLVAFIETWLSANKTLFLKCFQPSPLSNPMSSPSIWVPYPPVNRFAIHSDPAVPSASLPLLSVSPRDPSFGPPPP